MSEGSNHCVALAKIVIKGRGLYGKGKIRKVLASGRMDRKEKYERKVWEKLMKLG